MPKKSKGRSIVEDKVVEKEVKKPVSVDVAPTVNPVVSLQVFLKVFGKKWDQTAGFNYYAKKHGLEPLTILKWREAFEEFMNRPTQ